MKSKVAEKILARTPEDVKIFARLYGDLVVRINQILKEKGYTQKVLADKLDKRPSEVHKWLNNEHNFTLKSIAKLQAELGDPLLEVPKRPKSTSFQPMSVAFKVHINRERLSQRKGHIDWTRDVVPSSVKVKKSLADVG